MSFNSLPPLQLEPSRGPTQVGLTVGMFAATLGIPWLLPGLSWGDSLLLMVAGLIAVSVGLWRAGWIGRRHRLHRVAWDASGEWRLTGWNACRSGELRADSVVSRYFLRLKWNCEGGVTQLLLFRGDVSPAEWRRWTARLRLQAGRMPAAAAGPI